MAGKTYTLSLTGFTFPAALGDDKANFRFTADVRYFDAKGKPTERHVVLPGLDDYWECDRRKPKEPNYVRQSATSPTFNMRKIDDWDKLVLMVQAESIHSVRFKVFDVDRKDAWDQVQSVLGSVAAALIGKAGQLIPDIPAVSWDDTLGNATEDLEGWIVQKLAAQKDRVLFRGSVKTKKEQEYKISGTGEHGKYEVRFEISGE
jgi:hypothetical protein